jgi:septal ring factor EnvC (AmiA/AmiB activator)
MTKTPKPIGVVERITSWTGSVSSLVVHTMLFAGALIVGALGIAKWETVLLVLTTVVSLEAIYLSLLIQMTVNRNTESLREVEEDIDEIQEDVEEIAEDVDEIQADVEHIEKDIDEIQEDVQEIEKDVDEIQEDVEDLTEEEKKV